MTSDVVKVAPKIVKVVLENDRVRVLEMNFNKGDKLAMHTHPANFVYAVTPQKYKSTTPDGRERIVELKKGEVYSSGAVTHSVEFQIPGVLLQTEFK
ncbi:MAG: cytoplasmic protein [Thaumarchaeota archaeon]|nr:cytoplasmic protein [Nitrososphaerota archaeon]